MLKFIKIDQIPITEIDTIEDGDSIAVMSKKSGEVKRLSHTKFTSVESAIKKVESVFNDSHDVIIIAVRK